MPVHDWTLLEDRIFHDFHTVWIGQLRSALNEGVLPEGFYALAEQHAGCGIADILTLHGSSESSGPLSFAGSGGTALAEAPPRMRWRRTLPGTPVLRRRTIAVRHVSGHRLVALIEIVSPANKDRDRHVQDFVTKVVAALDAGIHVLVIDLIPPGPPDPHGLHEFIVQRLEQSEESHDLPKDEPLTLASYAAGPSIETFVEHLAVGAALVDMPLFLHPKRYVDVPLETTYQAAYRGLPAFWRNVLEGKGA